MPQRSRMIMAAIKVTMMKDFSPREFRPVKENLGGYKSDEQLKVARNARNELLIGGRVMLESIQSVTVMSYAGRMRRQ